MQAIYRLKKNASYDYVYKKGISFASKEMVMVALRVNANSIKAGFSVSKKIGKAVIRNKARRRMKESFRHLIPELQNGFNAVFVARNGIENADYAAISKSMKYLLKKANLLK